MSTLPQEHETDRNLRADHLSSKEHVIYRWGRIPTFTPRIVGVRCSSILRAGSHHKTRIAQSMSTDLLRIATTRIIE